MKRRVYGPKQAGKVAKVLKRYKRSSPAYGVRSFTAQGPRIGAPLGPVLRSTFRVAGNFIANPTALGTIYTQTFQVNNLFDPTAAIGADQPRGYDQLALLYQKYRVRSCKFNLQASNNASTVTSAGSFVIGFQFTDSSTAPTTYRDAVEQGYCVWKLCPAGLDSMVNLSMNLDVAKFKGKNIMDDELSALTSAGPADIVYCHMFIQALDSSADLGNIAVLYCLDFVADMFQPINVAAS